MESLCVTIIAIIMWGDFTALVDWDTNSTTIRDTALVRLISEQMKTLACSFSAC